MQRIVESENLEHLHPEYELQPRVYYGNLYRYMRCFIAGSIATKVDGLNECLEGAVVSLLRGSTKIKETMSDYFGDFKIDDLESNSGRYELEFNYHGKEVKTVEVELRTSLNIGIIWL
jgi:hypothetical protein